MAKPAAVLKSMLSGILRNPSALTIAFSASPPSPGMAITRLPISNPFRLGPTDLMTPPISEPGIKGKGG